MTQPANAKALQAALGSWESGDVDAAWNTAFKVLTDEPNNASALLLAGLVYERKGNLATAYTIFRRVTDLMPNEPRAWLHFGRVAGNLWQSDEAEQAYGKCLAMNPAQDSKVQALGNLAAIKVDNGKWPDAIKYAKRALALDSKARPARANLGFAQLATRDFANGWRNYHASVGTDWRHKVQYRDEPEWDGAPGKRVVIYGEQGLGDEISFASVIPDAIRNCSRVILDCDSRLAGLFQRSFPDAKVYGTRNAKHGKWAKEDRDFDASFPIGQLGEFYRLNESQFPGIPYLVSDPERAMMWKALFASKKKPAIGIAWRGGIPRTGAKLRQWDLPQLQPLFDEVDAHWVSLQYKDAAAEIEGTPVVQYPHATLTQDYDDTAALVASLDLVICMQTAVAHLGGALGVPTWVAVPKISQWRYGTDEESIPWYGSLKVIRQTDNSWKRDIERIAKDLSAHFGTVPGAASEAA